MTSSLPHRPAANPASQQQILSEVLARFAATENPRLREIMTSLITHLHAFVRDVTLTWAEWERAMALFAKAASVTQNGRNEFIALSDSIGVSMQVLATSQPKPQGATIPTLIGPFFLDDAPLFANGADLSGGARGEPLFATGRILDTRGRPLPGATIDVWHSDERGLYDVQDGFDGEHIWARGRLLSDEQGRYAFWTVMPTPYPAPMDAALGDLINNTTHKFWRPAHLHCAVRAEGADSLTTHLFVSGSEHIDEDVAFGVRPALIVDFVRHGPGIAPDGRTMDVAYRVLDYDFVLTRSGV